MFTDASVKKLKAHKKRYEKPDAHGLRLVVQPSGHKSWVMRFRRPDGRTAKLWLGTCDTSGAELEGEPAIRGHLTLAAARRLASEINRQRALGKDVVAERKAERQHRVVAAADAAKNTFPAAVRDYIEREARSRKRNRGWRSTAQVLGLDYPVDGGEPTLIPNGLAERWADRPVTSITGDDIYMLIDEARERGVPGREVRSKQPSEARARELSCSLSAMFRWLRGKRRVATDPTAGMERPQTSRRRERVLNTNPNVRGADELRWLWQASEKVNGTFGALVKVLLLTGQRRSEVAEMERRELSDDFSTWTIPATRTKNKRSHTVPLSPLVREILRGVLADTPPTTQFVFSTNGRSPVSGFSKLKPKLDQKMLAVARDEDPNATVELWTLHDLRRTCVTSMIEIGVEPHVVEATINHISGYKGGVAGVYNRSQLIEPVRRATERWASYIEAIVSGATPATVVPMRRRK
jgi:integrase